MTVSENTTENTSPASVSPDALRLLEDIIVADIKGRKDEHREAFTDSLCEGIHTTKDNLRRFFTITAVMEDWVEANYSTAYARATGNDVEFLEPGDTPTPDLEFIAMTPDDESYLSGNA